MIILIAGGAFAFFAFQKPDPSTQGVSQISSTTTPTTTTVSVAPDAWAYQGIALTANDAPNILMADVIRLESGGYRMYYNTGRKGAASIQYAESSDGLTDWTVKGTVLTGGSAPTDDDYIIGGSRVLHLQDGTYRMYYRATPDYGEKDVPSYSIYMATSPDGKTFTKYGVAIPNVREETTSTFSIVGHGAFYQLEDGTFAGFFSGNTLATKQQPSDLFFTTSQDGITWATPTMLYRGVHDPTAIKTSDGYIVIAMHLKDWIGIAASEDGKTWPKEMDRVSLSDAEGNSMNNQFIGDLSIVLTETDDILLYSNYANGNERGIAQYTQEK